MQCMIIHTFNVKKYIKGWDLHSELFYATLLPCFFAVLLSLNLVTFLMFSSLAITIMISFQVQETQFLCVF